MSFVTELYFEWVTRVFCRQLYGQKKFVVLNFADIFITKIELIHALQRKFFGTVTLSLVIIETGDIANVYSESRSWGR